MSALVSVIIPVYNLELYIENCLKSITSQTYNNIEIICIDDGSSDSSAEKIRQLSEVDNRIHYFYQYNSGVSAARNNGLQKAQGEYITFVDGDDYLHHQAIEILVDCAEKNDADIVVSDYTQTKNLDYVANKTDKSLSCKLPFDDPHFERQDLLKPVWGKLIKASLAVKQQFNSDFSVGEDTNYIVKLMAEATNIFYTDNKLYYYYIREGSAVRTAFSMKTFSAVCAYDDLSDYLKDKDSPSLSRFALYNVYMYIFSCRTSAKYGPYEKEVNKASKAIAKKHLLDMLRVKTIALNTKVLILAFLASRRFYELVRLLKDPTMKDFYKSRKNNSV